jgi:S-adenosylmethionine:tRNA ribosyltransferase-isomerase
LGSKAAPTAGLHFSDALLESIAQNFNVAEVTLHVGLGTFSPITDDDVKSQHLHEESFEISEDNAVKIEAAQHITAVGTTSLRTLESASNKSRQLTQRSGSTDIFIQPGYEFKMVDSLITNFHLPKSSLMMLVAAFMGFDEMHRVYQHAITERYRFYSFGDAMLII